MTEAEEKSREKEWEIVRTFRVFCSAEISTYMTNYAPDRAVVSTNEVAKCMNCTKYRAKKAIKELVSRGWIERASCGCPAIVSYGEYTELVCEAMPPKNGYALTEAGFETDLWKTAYAKWCKSMEEWANKPLEEEDE